MSRMEIQARISEVPFIFSFLFLRQGLALCSQAVFELKILLPPPPESSDYRYVAPCPVSF
jgi:hypothetical protein